jgi:hypothetical protein
VAYIQRAGDIDNRSLRQPEATQNVFGDLKNSLRRQNHSFVHVSTVCVLRIRPYLTGEFSGLRGQMAGHLDVEPLVDSGG